MGTRNLTMVILNQKTVVAQYGQWDGYPSGQGATILKTLLKNGGFSMLKSALDKCRFVDEDERQEYFKSIGVGEVPQYLTDEQVKQYRARFPLFNRDIGGEILESIMDASKLIDENPDEYDPNILLQDETSFAADSLFCEWCYVIDFDKGTFEVFEGFNQSPLADDERFKYLEGESRNEYKPVKHVTTYMLSELPDEDEFVEHVNSMVS